MATIKEILNIVKSSGDIGEKVRIDSLTVFLRDGRKILDCHYTLMRNGGYDEDWNEWMVIIDDELSDNVLLDNNIKLLDFDNEIVKEIERDGFRVWDEPYINVRKMTEADDEWSWDVVDEEVEDGMRKLDRMVIIK